MSGKFWVGIIFLCLGGCLGGILGITAGSVWRRDEALRYAMTEQTNKRYETVLKLSTKVLEINEFWEREALKCRAKKPMMELY